MCIESLLIYHVYHMIKFETMDEKNHEKIKRSWMMCLRYIVTNTAI
jgi:hypothetical protein